MEGLYIYTIGSVLAVSLISLIGLFTLAWNERFLRNCIFIFLGLATGALFGDAIVHLIPEALEKAKNPQMVSVFVALGLLTFFVLEKFLHWHHSGHGAGLDHYDEMVSVESRKVKPLGILILTSDSIHNLIDGLIIGGSFLVSIEVGIATTIAVALHEIPQEISDFGILIHSGFTKTNALVINFLSALLSIVGALLILWLGQASPNLVALISAFAAGSFLYIAGSDLVPELQKQTSWKKSFIQLVSIIIGFSIMYLLLFLD